jgi:antitoxin MazE
MYILPEEKMNIAKWGNSLAVRLPASVVKILDLQEGDDIEITVKDVKSFELKRKPLPADVLARLRKYRGRLPKDFKFDRIESHERGQ